MSTRSQPSPEYKTKELITLAALIEHPEAGLILFETGCAEDLDVVREHAECPLPPPRTNRADN